MGFDSRPSIPGQRRLVWPAAEVAPASARPERAGRARWVRLAVMALAVGAALFVVHQVVDWRRVQGWILGLDTPLTLVLMGVLPLGGFSVALLHLIAGAKFGLVAGGAVVAGMTAFHLLMSHWIANGVLRRPFERWFAGRRHRLPQIPAEDDVPVAVLVAIVPGIPYFMRNYFLALAGVPLRIYFWICLPIHVANAYVTLFLGNLTTNPSAGGAGWLLAVWLVKIAVCAEVIRRIRRHHVKA